MNREILFRGKRIDNGKWVYGHYASLLNARTEDGEPIKHMIVDGTPFGQTVDLATVGQYTGLIDKNGVKIFEGDVMGFDAYGFHYKGVVSFVDGNFCVMCNRPTASPFLDVAIKQHDAICVGNIHDMQGEQGKEGDD